jgi:antitoxin HicB
MREYTIILQPEPEGGYSVTVPALPGCFTQGRTIDEAAQRAREAIEVHLDGLIKRGRPVPEEDVHPLAMVVKVAA